jgi:hypothetical protein
LKNNVQNGKLFYNRITNLSPATGRSATGLPFPLDTPATGHYNIFVKVL